MRDRTDQNSIRLQQQQEHSRICRTDSTLRGGTITTKRTSPLMRDRHLKMSILQKFYQKSIIYLIDNNTYHR